MMHQLIDKKNRIALYLILLVVLSTTSNKTLQKNYNHSKINITIDVHGLSSNNNLLIKDQINNLLYKNIFFINKDSFYEIMSQYNLIESYNIKKIYPTNIKIQIKPTKFIAKIKNNEEFLIGSNGKLISNEYTSKPLPTLFGKFNSKNFLELKKKIDISKFEFTDLRAIFFFQSMRWDLETRDNILIKLPKKNLSNALKIAYKIINDQKFKDIQIIDLRIYNQVIITNE